MSYLAKVNPILRHLGREAGTPVTPDYDRHSSVFSGKINWVQIDPGKDDPVT